MSEAINGPDTGVWDSQSDIPPEENEGNAVTGDEMDWRINLPIVVMHAGCLLAFLSGVSKIAVATAVALYFIRMFGVTAGYHRYFSHAAFKTSRVGQFLLAMLAMSSAQMGILWWAAHHRYHHRFADKEGDPHSPLRGLWWGHLRWILARKNLSTRFEIVGNLAKFPELCFLDRHYLLPPVLLCISLFGFGEGIKYASPESGTSGFQMIVWGFFVSTTILLHGTCTINSLAHLFGTRRFDTDDTSRNNLWLALITMGEGWHNNHHRFPSSERQGYYWWEIDLTHYILKGLSAVGIVWDLREPPMRIYQDAEKKEVV